MRFIRTGMGCAGDPSCPCMPNSGMGSGFNVPSTLPGMPYDSPFGAFDTSMATVTFPVAVTGDNPLTIVPSMDGTYSVINGSQVVAAGLSQTQASDFVAQNGPGAAMLAANPVAANVLSGNPMQPSIVGTDDGSGMIAPGVAAPSLACAATQAINQHPFMTLAAVAAAVWLLNQHERRRAHAA